MEYGTNPFAKNAKQYINRGYSIIPVIYGEKRPAISAWTEFAQKYPTDNQITDWCTKRCNIGICTGRLSGIIGLDLDNDYDDIHAKILNIVPDSPVKKRGNKGFTAFYKYNGEHSHTLSVNGHQIGDLLSDSRQCVIPPSLHPNGENYEWYSLSLLDIPKDELPIITNDMWGKINTLLRPVIHHPKQHNHIYSENTDEYEIQKAINHIPPDCDYDTWCRVGMALHTHFNGGQSGFDLFNQWSSNGSKYKTNEPHAKWTSFTPDNGIGIGTLFYIAKQYGYSPLENNQIRLLSLKDEMAIKQFLYGE